MAGESKKKMDAVLFALGLGTSLLPIPCLIFAVAFTERRKLYRDIEKEEAIYRMRTGRGWKRRILRSGHPSER